MPFKTLVRRLALTLACVGLAIPAAAQGVQVNVGLGGAQADGVNGGGVLSGDGRFVVFASRATNLVAGDTNASADVFVRDVAGATTSRVSLGDDGLERTGASGYIVPLGGQNGGQEIDISDDGRFVVFTSRAALVAADTATCTFEGETTATNCPDIYLRDRQAGTTVRISVGTGGAQPNGASLQPNVSGDGRWVVFASDASNLVANDTNGVQDVFLFDRQTSAMTRISQATGGAQADSPSGKPAISDDGAVIAFVSTSTLLSAEPDTVPCQRAPPACDRPFMVDRLAGTTRRVPMPPIATVQTIEIPPGPPIVLTYRVTASSVRVAPDGTSVVVGASVISSLITISTGISSRNWIYDRGRNRIVLDFEGIGIGGWDGRRYTSNTVFTGTVTFGQSRFTDTVAGLGFELGAGSGNALPGASGIAANGRFVLTSVFDIDNGRFDLYVRDLDPDGDGMPSFWEDTFGLDPAVGTDGAGDPDTDGATNQAEYQRGTHPFGTVVRYLAEGASNTFFATNIAVANPGASEVTVLVRYQGDDGTNGAETLTLPGRSTRHVSAVPAPPRSRPWSRRADSSRSIAR